MNSQKSYKELADMAAGWWAEAVTTAKYDGIEIFASSKTIPFLTTSLFEEVDEATKTEFREILSRAIEDRLVKEEGEEFQIFTTLSPDEMLLCAANHSKMPVANFPWKIVMRISKGHVVVGSGAPDGYVPIYANSEYWLEEIVRTKGYMEGVERWVNKRSEEEMDSFQHYVKSLADLIRRQKVNYDMARACEIEKNKSV